MLPWLVASFRMTGFTDSERMTLKIFLQLSAKDFCMSSHKCGGKSLKEKLSNYLLVAVLQAMLAVCRGIKIFQAKIRVAKHAHLIYECITYYIYAYQLHCTKQDVLRTLIRIFYTSATEAKHTSLYALLLNRHPCRFRLGCEQSSKNI